MIVIGKEYRVWSLKEGTSAREGVALEVDGPMFMLDVQGVQTTYHMAAVACVELVDRDAEEVRRKSDTEKRIAAWS
jgi:hypothetical protein